MLQLALIVGSRSSGDDIASWFPPPKHSVINFGGIIANLVKLIQAVKRSDTDHLATSSILVLIQSAIGPSRKERQ